MKRVLFVGDGKHDIGGPDWPTDTAFPAGGVVSHLASRVAAIEREGSLALPWAQIPRLSPGGKRGYSAKIKAAQLLAERRYRLEGVVAVVDEDNDPTRRALAGVTEPAACPAVCGVAVKSIEAWTLGTPTALAGVLGTSREALRGECPTAPVEQLYEGSGKEALRPKRLLRELARKLGRRADSLALREEVAAGADVDELCESCPEGFAPFAASLRATFGAAGP